MTTRMPLLVLGLSLACAKSSAPPGDTVTVGGTVIEASTLFGSRWRLVELDGQPSIAGGGAREAHLVFSATEARVTGATGCNSMGGRYEGSGDRIRFSDLISTKMACVEEERMRQETRFLNALHSVDRYAIRGDTLALSAGERVVARFVKS